MRKLAQHGTLRCRRKADRQLHACRVRRQPAHRRTGFIAAAGVHGASVRRSSLSRATALAPHVLAATSAFVRRARRSMRHAPIQCALAAARPCISRIKHNTRAASRNAARTMRRLTKSCCQRHLIALPSHPRAQHLHIVIHQYQVGLVARCDASQAFAQANALRGIGGSHARSFGQVHTQPAHAVAHRCGHVQCRAGERAVGVAYHAVHGGDGFAVEIEAGAVAADNPDFRQLSAPTPDTSSSLSGAKDYDFSRRN